LRAAGWDIDLQAHVRRGGHVLGICGGYQMLGRTVADPHGIEGPPSKVEGLGLLAVDTVLEGDKVLVEVAGKVQGVAFKGYEMHIGRTTGSVTPLLELDGHDQGAVSGNGRIAGCYIHGLLTDDNQRRHWLQRLGAATSDLDYEADVDATLDRLADHIEKHIDCDRLLALAKAR
jgi:adenosylcobyric acid synthase